MSGPVSDQVLEKLIKEFAFFPEAVRAFVELQALRNEKKKPDHCGHAKFIAPYDQPHLHERYVQCSNKRCGLLMPVFKEGEA